MRHHAVRPLMREQRLDLGPGPRLVIMRLAERREAGVPTPLEGIKSLGGHGVGAVVVLFQHLHGVIVDGGSVGGSHVVVSMALVALAKISAILLWPLSLG